MVVPAHPPELQYLRCVFEKQRVAFSNSEAPPMAERRSHLAALEHALKVHGAALEHVISADFGNRSVHETRLLELFPAIEAAKYARSQLARWIRKRRLAPSIWFQPARLQVVWQPRGVVGVIVPWNYPILLAVGPLVCALAAGNRVMIKMSEVTPRTAEYLKALVSSIFDEDHVAVITGDPAVASAFSALAFDHLLFTGSTAIGHSVMRSAAKHLTPITLELGGKSPAIVAPGFPISLAASRILRGKCLNAGQTCIAPDYVLIPKGHEDGFIRASRAVVSARYPTVFDNPDYTSIIDERHYRRLVCCLDDARQKGAVIVPLHPTQAWVDPTSRKISPMLLFDIDDSMQVMQEEIFGPLLPVQTYSDLTDAINYVNVRPHPLALYYFDYNRRNRDRIVKEARCGGVTINDTLLHITQDKLPFGGLGPSGMGYYHGREGFETFSHKKPVFVQARWNLFGMFEPPYGWRFESLLRLLLR